MATCFIWWMSEQPWCTVPPSMINLPRTHFDLLSLFSCSLSCCFSPFLFESPYGSTILLARFFYSRAEMADRKINDGGLRWLISAPGPPLLRCWSPVQSPRPSSRARREHHLYPAILITVRPFFFLILLKEIIRCKDSGDSTLRLMSSRTSRVAVFTSSEPSGSITPPSGVRCHVCMDI